MLSGMIALIIASLAYWLIPAKRTNTDINVHCEESSSSGLHDEPVYVTFACGSRVKGCPYHFDRLDDLIGVHL